MLKQRLIKDFYELVRDKIASSENVTMMVAHTTNVSDEMYRTDERSGKGTLSPATNIYHIRETHTKDGKQLFGDTMELVVIKSNKVNVGTKIEFFIDNTFEDVFLPPHTGYIEIGLKAGVLQESSYLHYQFVDNRQEPISPEYTYMDIHNDPALISIITSDPRFIDTINGIFHNDIHEVSERLSGAYYDYSQVQTETDQGVNIPRNYF